MSDQQPCENVGSLPGLVSRALCVQQLGTGQCTVHIVRFRNDEFDCSAFNRAGIGLPSPVAASASRRRATFFFGRLAASEALSPYGFAHCEVAIGDAREPLFPMGTVGSITHTDALAAAVVLPSPPWRGVGIDIERPIRADLLEHMESVVLSEAEKDLLASCSSHPRSVLVALVFSAKESLYKALSKASGRFLEFDAFRLAAVDARTRRMRFISREALSPDWPCGTACEVDYTLLHDGHVLTVFGW